MNEMQRFVWLRGALVLPMALSTQNLVPPALCTVRRYNRVKRKNERGRKRERERKRKRERKRNMTKCVSMWVIDGSEKGPSTLSFAVGAWRSRARDSQVPSVHHFLQMDSVLWVSTHTSRKKNIFKTSWCMNKTFYFFFFFFFSIFL